MSGTLELFTAAAFRCCVFEHGFLLVKTKLKAEKPTFCFELTDLAFGKYSIFFALRSSLLGLSICTVVCILRE